MRRASTTVVFLAGCAKVFGIDEGPLPTPYDVHGTLAHAGIDVDGVMHAPLVSAKEGFATGEVVATLYSPPDLDDALALGVTPQQVFGFGFTIADPWELTIHRTGDAPRQFDGAFDPTDTKLATSIVDVGRLTAPPISDGTEPVLSFTGIVFPPNDRAWFTTTGVFTETPIDLTTLALPWRDALPTGTAPVSLLESTDGEYVTAFAYDQVTQTWTVAAVPQSPPQFTMAADGVTRVSGTGTAMVPASAPLVCAHVQATLGLERQRVQDAIVVPATVSMVGWTLYAMPAPSTTPLGGLRVAYFDVGAGSVPAQYDQSVSFQNPFSGLEPNLVGELAETVQYTYTAPNATMPGTIVAGTSLIVSPVPTAAAPVASTPCTADPLALASMVGLSGAPMLGETTLDQVQDVALPAADHVVIAWNEVVASQPAVSFWRVTVHEVVADASGRTQFPARLVVSTRAKHTRIPTATFVAGHMYLVRVEARVGYPDAAQGDYATFAYPVGGGSQLSAPFTIR